MGRLYLEYLGEEVTLDDGDSLSFGRSADLVVDADNRYLHRVLGSFVPHGDVWFLQNTGRHIPLHVLDATGPSRAEVGPGDQVPLGFAEFTVAFDAGPARYEIRGALEENGLPGVGTSAPTDTVEFGLVALNSEQRLLVAALAEPLLRGRPDWVSRMPGNKEVARRLGWTLPKYNRKLDHLCRRLAEEGVDGVLGTASTLATNRRQVVVRHLVDSGLVTAADLEALPPLA